MAKARLHPLKALPIPTLTLSNVTPSDTGNYDVVGQQLLWKPCPALRVYPDGTHTGYRQPHWERRAYTAEQPVSIHRNGNDREQLRGASRHQSLASHGVDFTSHQYLPVHFCGFKRAELSTKILPGAGSLTRPTSGQRLICRQSHVARFAVDSGQWENMGDDSLSKVKRRVFNMRILAAYLTCLACSAVTTNLFAQGQINWNNTGSTLISVNGSPMPVRVSPETTYYFGLFVAPLGTPAPSRIDDPNWQYVAAYAMNSTAAAGAGRMQNPGIATVIGYAAGTPVNFIVRGWQSNSGGADWPAAKPGLIYLGQSAMGTAKLGGGAIPVPSAFGPSPGQIGGFDFGNLDRSPPWFVMNPSNAVVSLGGTVTLTAYAVNW